MKANSQRPGTGRIVYIALLIAFPVITTVGFATYAQLAVTGRFEPWRSLGGPPEHTTRIIGVCYERVCVETAEHTQYFECSSFYEDKSCWKRIDLPAEQVTSFTAEGHNPCVTEFNMPHPPDGTIQLEGAKICDSGGATQTYYALQEDGTVWMWQLSMADYSSLATLAGIVNGLIFGVTFEVLFVTFVFAIQQFRSRNSMNASMNQTLETSV